MPLECRLARLDEARQPERSAECEPENEDPVQRSTRLPRHQRGEKIQQRVVQQIEPEGGSGEPAYHFLEPTSRHRKLHFGKSNEEQGKKGANNVVVSRRAGW